MMKGSYGSAGKGRGILDSASDDYKGGGRGGGRGTGGWRAAILVLALLSLATVSMTMARWLFRGKIDMLEVPPVVPLLPHSLERYSRLGRSPPQSQRLVDDGQDRLDECHVELEESRNQTSAERGRAQEAQGEITMLREKVSDTRSLRDRERKEALDRSVTTEESMLTSAPTPACSSR